MHQNPPPGRWRRARSVCSGLVCSAALWGAAAVAHGATARPTLAQLPIASLPRQDSLKAPERVETTSEDLPFEIVVPAERQSFAKLKTQANSYGSYQHLLTLKARDKDVCLRAAGSSRSEDRDQVVLAGYSNYPNQVVSVRAERLSLEGGPALVVDDFFVDPAAAQVKREATRRLPLVKVADAPQGLAIYAFREHHQLHLVLTAPLATMIGPNARPIPLGCGMSRVSLETTGRSGVATSFAIGLPGSVEPERVEQFHAYDPIPMRRAVRVSVSVSQTSRDPAPILSLTFGDPSPPVRDALKNQMPRWNDVLGAEQAQKLEQELAKR